MVEGAVVILHCILRGMRAVAATNRMFAVCAPESATVLLNVVVPQPDVEGAVPP